MEAEAVAEDAASEESADTVTEESVDTVTEESVDTVIEESVGTVLEDTVAEEPEDEVDNEIAEEAEEPAAQPANPTYFDVSQPKPKEVQLTTITVLVNGERVELLGKESYIFVDIFDRITFDLQAGRGKAIVTMINGREAQFSEELHEGDKIELYWKEN